MEGRLRAVEIKASNLENDDLGDRVRTILATLSPPAPRPSFLPPREERDTRPETAAQFRKRKRKA